MVFTDTESAYNNVFFTNFSMFLQQKERIIDK